MASAVGVFELRTNFTPPIRLDPATRGAGGAILKLLKPTLDGSILGQPVHYAPFGDASEGIGSFVVFAVAALAVLGLVSLVRKL